VFHLFYIYSCRWKSSWKVRRDCNSKLFPWHAGDATDSSGWMEPLTQPGSVSETCGAGRTSDPVHMVSVHLCPFVDEELLKQTGGGWRCRVVCYLISGRTAAGGLDEGRTDAVGRWRGRWRPRRDWQRTGGTTRRLITANVMDRRGKNGAAPQRV